VATLESLRAGALIRGIAASGPAEKAVSETPSKRSDRVAVELCAGLGGISIGLETLGFRVERAYDSWGEAVAIYNHNFGSEVAVQCNLLTEAGRKLVKADCKRMGDIELLATGPPCKGFSQLRNGRHDGRNGHNRVLAALPDYVEVLRPRIFLIENVPDLVRHRNGRTLSSLLGQLERPGARLVYRVEHQIYDAALFGTPQARRRLFILGVRCGSGHERLPEPGPDLRSLFAAIRHGGPISTELIPYLRALKDPDDEMLTSSRQALSDLPVLGPGEPEEEREYASGPRTAFQKWIRKRAPTHLRDTRTPDVNRKTTDRLAHIPPGGCARAIPEKHLNGLSRRYDSAYRRLHPEAPSTALSTKYDCVYHYSEPRSLSVREYARRSAYEMIGNSVPPLLVAGVLRAILAAERRSSKK
jgi:DNA (cytosine-5)-methyltransferase 1